MTDIDDNGHDEGQQPRKTGFGRKARLGIAAAGLIGIGTALGGLAVVSFDAGAHMFGGGHHGRHSVEHMTERARDKTAWVLGKLDATPEQEQQMDVLVTTLVDQLYPIREQHLEHRRAFVAELLRTRPDKGKLEGLRQQELMLADLASARVLDAVVQASEMLTPGQREELLEYASRFRGHHH